MAPKREAGRPLSHVGLKEEELIYLSMNLGISERCEVATLFLRGVAISPIFDPSRPVKIPFRPLLRRFLGFWTYNWAIGVSVGWQEGIRGCCGEKDGYIKNWGLGVEEVRVHKRAEIRCKRCYCFTQSKLTHRGWGTQRKREVVIVSRNQNLDIEGGTHKEYFHAIKT